LHTVGHFIGPFGPNGRNGDQLRGWRSNLTITLHRFAQQPIHDFIDGRTIRETGTKENGASRIVTTEGNGFGGFDDGNFFDGGNIFSNGFRKGRN